MKPEERRRQAFDKRAIYPGWRGGKPLTIQGGYACPCNQNDSTNLYMYGLVGKEDNWAGVEAPPNSTPYNTFVHTSTNEQRMYIAFEKDAAGNAMPVDFSGVKEIWINMGYSGYVEGSAAWNGLTNSYEIPREGIWSPLWVFAYAITDTWAVPDSGSANQIAWASQPITTWSRNGPSFVNPATSKIDNYVASIRLGSTSVGSPTYVWVQIAGAMQAYHIKMLAKSAGSADTYNLRDLSPTGTFQGDYGLVDTRDQIVRMEVSDNAPLSSPIYGLMLIPFTLYDLYTYDGQVYDLQERFLLDNIPAHPNYRTYSDYDNVTLINRAERLSPGGGASDFPFDYSLIPSSGTAYEDMQYATMGYNITNDKALLLIPASC